MSSCSRKNHIVYVSQQTRKSNDGWSVSTVIWAILILLTITVVISHIGGF